ncbi:hypothetical protein EB118_16575 [bacterium]|nr:hypothetical protein [bacterium]
MKKGKLNLPSGKQLNPNTNKAKSPPPPPPLTSQNNHQQEQQPRTAGIPLIDGKPPSVMVAVPAMEMVNAEFAQHLAMSCANLVAHGIRINCAFNIGSVITIARRNLVDIFLKSDFNYIWWVDSDMKFPVDSPLRLLARNKDIVGCNYRRRRFPNPNFTGMSGAAGKFQEFTTTDLSPPMEEIDVLPHGLVMVRRHVYEKTPQPHYLQEFIPEMNLEIGEDIFFCQQAKKAGWEIWCDQELSREIAHIGIFHFNYNLSVPK